MIKKALDFINKEIEGCIMNIDFCKHKGYDSPLHDQRLIDLNNLKEAFEKLVDKATPTLEEVKKEWEKLGYEWKENEIYIHITKKDKLLCVVKDICITKQDKEYCCYDEDEDYSCLSITYKEHNLLIKTFKALGWEV